jgi:hypothetical protein
MPVGSINPSIYIGYRNSGSTGFRSFHIAPNSAFFLTIGDAGNVNANTSTSIVQALEINYAAPGATLTVQSDGKCYSLQFIGTSDERTKTDIETIHNALWKVQQLRGVRNIRYLEISKKDVKALD